MSEPTDQLTAANNGRDLLQAAIGPTVGYHISECKAGGYVVVVNGSIHAAASTLHEAVTIMGVVASNEYGKSATPPERATDVTPQRREHMPVEDDPSLDGRPRVLDRPPLRPQPGTPRAELRLAQARATATVALVALVIGVRVVMGA